MLEEKAKSIDSSYSPSPPKIKMASTNTSPKISSCTAKTEKNLHPQPPPVPLPAAAAAAAEYLFDDTCILDMDYFVKTITGLKSKGVRPDLVGSIIAHYSSKWLPDLSHFHSISNISTSADDHSTSTATSSTSLSGSGSGRGDDDHHSGKTATALWAKKRFFVETLVGILPVESGAVPCNFLLRLLRVAATVGVDPACRAELEGRIASQLEQADLKEMLIPSFTHTCRTLLDVDLVTRLVRSFLVIMNKVDATQHLSSLLLKVARLVDGYLAEAALDSNLELGDFIDLAGALPAQARTCDDGLYRAIDTYLKAHPNITKQERKLLCRLIDTRKLSSEASLHATQNDRLPVRMMIQVLFSEQGKLSRQLDWSASSIGCWSRSSPSPAAQGIMGVQQLIAGQQPGPGLEHYSSARCLSKREHQSAAEIRKLREDLLRLQTQCNAMQCQMERLNMMSISTNGGHKYSKSTTTSRGGFFARWRKIGMIPSFRNNHVVVGNGDNIAALASSNVSDYSSYLKFEDQYYGRDQEPGPWDNANLNIGRFGFGVQTTPTIEPRSKATPKGRTTPNKWRKSTSSS